MVKQIRSFDRQSFVVNEYRSPWHSIATIGQVIARRIGWSRTWSRAATSLESKGFAYLKFQQAKKTVG
jgi:hypothetical protein